MESVVPSLTAVVAEGTPLAVSLSGLVVLAGGIAIGKFAISYVIRKVQRAA